MDFLLELLICGIAVLAYLGLRNYCDHREMEIIRYLPMVDAIITNCELAVEDTTGTELSPILYYSYKVKGASYRGRVRLKPWRTDGSPSNQSPYLRAEQLKGQTIRVYYDPYLPKKSLFLQSETVPGSLIGNPPLFRRLIWLYFW